MPGKLTAANIRFGVMASFLALAAHATAYLTHEYAHSFLAWALGWMADPLGLDYGAATLNNILFLADVSDNVGYGPIFAHGHGVSAAMIALAGPFIGNGLLYFIAYRLAKTKALRASPTRLSFVYWLSVMCAGNVWSYVPLRALTTHADIALAAQGLGVSTWVLFPFLMAISLYIGYHFFYRMFPACFRQITAESNNHQILFIAMTSFWYFSFFAGDGIGGSYGTISELLSIASRYILFPLSTMFLASSYCFGSNADDDRRLP